MSTCNEALRRQPRRDSGPGREARRHQRGVPHLRLGSSRSVVERWLLIQAGLCRLRCMACVCCAFCRRHTFGVKAMLCAATDITWLVVPTVSAAVVTWKAVRGAAPVARRR